MRRQLQYLGIFTIGLVLLSLQTAIGGSFTEISTSLPELHYSSMSWGDYDGDGDLDIAVMGRLADQPPLQAGEIYRNDGGSFVAIGAGISVGYSGSLSWGDFDNDGDLDLFQSGYGSDSDRMAQWFRNDGNDTFTPESFPGDGVGQSFSDVGDYDNDGDLDLFYSGSPSFGEDAVGLFRNDGTGGFSHVPIGVPVLRRGSVDWGDYDNDGDQDLLITGQGGPYPSFTAVYRNDGNDNFVEITSPFLQQYDGEAVWGDYDQDGDLDILGNGSNSTSTQFFSQVYRNDGNDNFVDIGATLPDAGEGSTLKIGDLDADGDFDVLMTGVNASGAIFLYASDSTFIATDDSIPYWCCGSSAVGDYDNDHDLDVLVGVLSTGTYFYRNDSSPANTLPTVPSNLSSTTSADTAFLSWAPAIDAQTSSLGLTYNVRIGTTPGGVEIVSPMSDPITGFRQIVAQGNTDHALGFEIRGLAEGVYYWSVQSVDNHFAGSPFATEAAFVIGDPEITCGDADGSGIVSISDAVHIINFIFGGGPAPVPEEAGDVDCNEEVTISDAVYLINSIFGGGPAPCDSC